MSGLIYGSQTKETQISDPDAALAAGSAIVNDLVLNLDRLGLPLPWRVDSLGRLWAANGRLAVQPDPNNHLTDAQVLVAGLNIWIAVQGAAGLSPQVEVALAAMES